MSPKYFRKISLLEPEILTSWVSGDPGTNTGGQLKIGANFDMKNYDNGLPLSIIVMMIHIEFNKSTIRSPVVIIKVSNKNHFVSRRNVIFCLLSKLIAIIWP